MSVFQKKSNIHVQHGGVFSLSRNNSPLFTSSLPNSYFRSILQDDIKKEMLWSRSSVALSQYGNVRTSYLEIYGFFHCYSTARSCTYKKACLRDVSVRGPSKPSFNRSFRQTPFPRREEQQEEDSQSFQSELLLRVQDSCMFTSSPGKFIIM